MRLIDLALPLGNFPGTLAVGLCVRNLLLHRVAFRIAAACLSGTHYRKDDDGERKCLDGCTQAGPPGVYALGVEVRCGNITLNCGGDLENRSLAVESDVAHQDAAKALSRMGPAGNSFKRQIFRLLQESGYPMSKPAERPGQQFQFSG